MAIAKTKIIKHPVRKKTSTQAVKKRVVISRPARKTHASPELRLLPLMLKSFLLSFIIAFILLAITGLIVAGYFYHKSLLFTEPAQTTLIDVAKTFYAGWYKTPIQDNGKVNFLILGSDELANRDSEMPLTDTMIVTSLNLNTAQISLYSLPRDIWLPNYKSKINTVYAYSQKQYPTESTKIPQEIATQLTGVPIHHSILIKLTALSELVDLVGGVDVNIKESFTDTQFPRTDVDVTKVHDPKLLYETVSFASGSAHMDGKTVLKYVRSRHSTGIEGSDNARGTRQQEVILALTEKMKDPHFFYDLHRDGQLYHFYMTNFSQYLPLTEMIAIGKQLLPHLKNISFTQGTPSIFPTDKNGVIYHPTGSALQYFGAWVYEIKDKTAFQTEAKKVLHY